MNRRTFLLAGTTAAASALTSTARASTARARAAARPPISPTLTARDPLASENAQNVYSRLVALENKARAGTSPMTIMGQHIEGQNELYNPGYGDTGGTTYVGYYYNKVEAITGKLPGFVEIDFGPGWNSENGWGVFNSRGYDDGRGLPIAQKQWQYLDDAADLAFDVWKGFPRPADGTYDYNGTAVNVDGSTSVSAPLANGGSAAGIVGVSFHQPYPGATLKDYSQVLAQSAGQYPGNDTSYPVATITTNQAWFNAVVNWQDNTAAYQDLLTDLAFAGDQLSYFAEYDVPVLLRPYHEMNGDWFWWGGKTLASYQQLWQIMDSYLVNTRGLHNLIFVWSPSAWTPNGSGSPTPETSDFTSIYHTGLQDYAKPRMLAETYKVPITANGTNALAASPWVIWTVRGQLLTADNSGADVKATYYATSRVYTVGSGTGYGQNIDWGTFHTD